MVLLLLIHFCCCSHCFVGVGLSFFVVQYLVFVSFQVLQSSRWGRDSWLFYLNCLLMTSVPCLFLARHWVGLQCVIGVFTGHTCLLCDLRVVRTTACIKAKIEVYGKLFTGLGPKNTYLPCLNAYSKTCVNGHSKIDKPNILMTNGSLIKVESITQCAPPPWSILRYF